MEKKLASNIPGALYLYIYIQYCGEIQKAVHCRGGRSSRNLYAYCKRNKNVSLVPVSTSEHLTWQTFVSKKCLSLHRCLLIVMVISFISADSADVSAEHIKEK